MNLYALTCQILNIKYFEWFYKSNYKMQEFCNEYYLDITFFFFVIVTKNNRNNSV